MKIVMTMAEIKEYKQLHEELMGDNMFMIVDVYDPKWQRFELLSNKMQELRSKFSNYSAYTRDQMN